MRLSPASQSPSLKFTFTFAHVKAACAYIGMELEWEGSGDTEIAKEKKTGIVSCLVSLLYVIVFKHIFHEQ